MAIDFSGIGSALAAPARSAMIAALMDGTARPAGELAGVARVRPSTASEHLAQLVDIGLLAVATHGRQRLYRIADAEVAGALERLGRLCPQTTINSYRQSREAQAISRARLCYDHLAGVLGVGVADALSRSGWIDLDTLSLTEAGRSALAGQGFDVAALATGRRRLLRSCPDWTQRRPHLAGALGAALAERALHDGWVSRRPGSRGLTITPLGRRAFVREWGLEPAAIT